MSRRTIVSALFLAGFCAVVATGQTPGPAPSPDDPTGKKSPPVAGGKKAAPTDAAVKAALANDSDVQVARAKVLLAEAELAKAKQAVVLKVMSLRAAIQENENAVAGAQERYAWAERMAAKGLMEQSQLADARNKLEAAKIAHNRAQTELKLLTESGNEVGMEAGPVTSDAALHRSLRWFTQRMADPAWDAGDHSNTMMALAALYGAQATKAPVGAVPDRIRAALDKSVRIGQKGESVTFEKALEVFKKEAGLDVPVRYGGRAGIPSPIKVEGEELPIGAWFQLYQDQDGNVVRLYVRDYGLLLTTKDMAPPDAPTLTEFWKQKLQKAKEPTEVTDPIKKPGR